MGFSFSTFVCDCICYSSSLHSCNKISLQSSEIFGHPSLCSLCVISCAISSPSLQFKHSTNQTFPGAAFPRLSPTLSLKASWFSFQTIYHSIRSEHAINQTMIPPPWRPVWRIGLKETQRIQEWYRTTAGNRNPVKSVFLGLRPAVGAKDNTDTRARPTFHFTLFPSSVYFTGLLPLCKLAD